MKNPNSSGDMKRRNNKEKPVKKRATKKCKNGCREFYVSSSLIAGVCYTCRVCDYTFCRLPPGYTDSGPKKGLKSKVDPEKAKKYTAKRKAAKEKEMDMNIEALISLT